jgi:hypothetical protein
MRCGGNVGEAEGDALSNGVGERPGGSGLPDAVGVGDGLGEALGVGLGRGVALGPGGAGATEPLPTARGDGGGGVASCVATSSR